MSKRIKMIIGMLIAAVVCVGIVYAFVTTNDKEEVVQLNYIYDFTEQSIPMEELDIEEKKLIINYLQNHYIQDKGFYLLSNNDYGVFEKIYASYSVLKGIDKFNDENNCQRLVDIFKKCEQNIGNYSIPAYDYIYYMAIKCELGEYLEKESYIHALEKYIDKDTGLFYFMAANEDVDTKLLISAKIAFICHKYNIDISMFNLNDKIAQIYGEYKFYNIEEGKSLYNSGGTLLYAIEKNNMEYIEREDINTWFTTWSEYYNEFNITDEMSYIEYYSYYQVSKLFGKKDVKKIEEYIMNYVGFNNELEGVEIIDIQDYFVEEFSYLLSETQKDNIANIVDGKIKEIEQGLIGEIDIASTYYGADLAYESGFDVDYIKCRETIEQMYETTMNEMDNETFVYNTYYYVMFMKSFETKKIDSKIKDTINERLDRIISELIKTDNVDMGLLRYCLEIKSNMLSYVTKTSYDRIKELISDIVSKKQFNSKIIDVIKIDRILETNIINQEYIDKCLAELYEDGAYKCKTGYVPDLKTTYLVYSLLTNHDIFHPTKEQVNGMKKFVESLNRSGLYTYESEDEYIDFRSIYYGYILKKIALGDKYE